MGDCTEAEEAEDIFKKKDETQVREERETADARAAAAQAEVDSCRLEAAHKYNLLVAKWQLPPRPSLQLVRGPGESGKHKYEL